MADVLKEGEKAPEFKLESTEGPIRLKDFRGAPLVLFFYPKDDTPGCTTEASDFSALVKNFSKLNANIVGVSKDSLESHRKFIAKHTLKITLASDPDGEVLQAYGAWGQKSLYGRTFDGILRTTYLIDAKGKVAKVWKKVSPKGHAQAVLTALEEAA